MKIIAFAGSNSSTSINKQLVTYAVSLFKDAQPEILDLNDYELPLFSEDRERELGKPMLARTFLDKIESADVLVISLAEHNAAFSVAFKNIYDWASRQKKEVFDQKPMLLLATSPGRGGGRNVIEAAKISLPKYGGNIKATFFMPLFNENFNKEKGQISNEEYDSELKNIIRHFDFET